ncbi:MAG: apolipoprotein N-acyltransferase [Acidobacteria bacterium]|nr:MAG: apolipoprotein N-acyltransferase [Acidobacteriota bacterium]
MLTRSADVLRAAVAGLLLAFSFPRFGHPALAWIALAPLLAALCAGRLRHAFLLGLLTGGIYFTGTLYWITRVMVVYGGLQGWIAVPVNAALIAYLALFPGLFALVVRRLTMVHGPAALMAAPLVWIATELGMFASVTIAIVVAIALWGSRRVAASEWTRSGDPIRVGLIQGNVDQAQKWDATRAAVIFDDYLQMTRRAIAERAQFVLWPESSTPFLFEEEPAGAERIRTLAVQAHVPILFGSDQIVWRIAGNRRIPDKYFNSAFLVRPDGTTGGVYRKMHLVPFGEYVPLQRVLFFAAPLTEQVGTFAPGETPELLPVNGHPISVAICYEVVYPALVREFVRGGSEMLTTITNDAWFGETSAPYQHFEQSSMRAIEEGRYLVRSANTGISGIVDPYGRVVEKTSIFQQAVLVGEARFLRTSTFYARHGDILAYAATLAAVALVIASWPMRRRVQ